MAEPYPICYLNGEYLPLADARISPLDRGFLYGDGVYEVIPVYGGRPFRLEAHLRRS
jgi:D-alanine transaminase